MDQQHLRPDLRSVFQQFSEIKGEYCKSRIDLRSKEEVIKLQSAAMEAAKRRLDMMAEALENYQNNYKNNLNKLQGDNYQLMKRIEEVEETCRNLQQNNHDLIMESNKRRNDEVEGLQEEIAMLKAQIAETERRHRDELEQLKEERAKEMAEKMQMIEQLNKKIKILTEQKLSQTQFVHPALYDEVGKLKNRTVKKKKATNTSAFAWPDLDVQKVKKPDNSTSPPPKKMKKLYHEDTTDLVDLEK